MKRNPFIQKSEWEARAEAEVRAREQSDFYDGEYQRLLPRLEKMYASMSAEEQADLEAMDRWFSDGDREPLVNWVRERIPGAFKFEPKRVSRPEPRAVLPVEPLAHLPNLVYHGTRNLPALLTRGFEIGPATELDAHAGVDTYCWQCRVHSDLEGFPIRWGTIVWGWYKTLTKSGKQLLQKQAGQRIRSISDLGEAISLLWTAEGMRLAQDYSRRYPVVEIDTSKMPIYGWIEPDLAGKDEVVLILPSSGWQGGPEAITRLWVPD